MGAALAVRIGNIEVGRESGRLLLIAGPCVAESLDLCRTVAAEVKAICEEMGFAYVFKASFDKANRTSGAAFRGAGMDAGLEILSAIRSEFGVPALTDIHESWQAKPVAEVVDALQIPAFLCRQTDLLLAAAGTGKAVNVKKGQFLAPWDMANVARKVVEAGNENLILTERGVSFGYNTLVVDMTSLPQMRALGYPVCFDATHSTQKPGGAGTASGGSREMIPYLARAATATGIDALFMEVHPEPEKGLSDAATMFRLSELRPLLRQIREIEAIVREKP
jgi:2-dehydro-3-deoxyphosphooctonate aldolase (KDO 8-P synthase)